VHTAAVRNFDEWRDAARRFIAAGIGPSDIFWSDARSPAVFGPVAEGVSHGEAAGSARTAPRIPKPLMELLETLALYRNPGRWELMYRLIWRVLNESRALLENQADADVQVARNWAKAVTRDVHKMHAFVRFHETANTEGEKLYVAWFEPEHEILRHVAPFFEQRFPNMKWLIATPDGAAVWNGTRTEFTDSPGSASLPHSDDTHDLWRTYYRSICNVARVNPRLMRKEMPERYWRHLPEATEIDSLIRDGRSRQNAMLAAAEAQAREDLRVPLAVSRHLETLKIPAESLQACRRCGLWRHATQAVPGEGPRNAGIMLVGEQPGDEEDLRGRAFTGPAGRLLDGLLKGAGLERGELYITNAVKHFKWEPRGKRRLHKRPDRQEVQACAPWLEHEIDSVSPRVIVALGATAIRAVAGVAFSVEQARSTRLQHAGGAAVIATYHPSAILRAEGERKRVLSEALTDDLRAAASYLRAASNSATSLGGAVMRHAR
jgi:probable DNA metabolism protein